MNRLAFYPGSFDPATLGHIDIMARAARIFDGVMVGVGVHHGKPPLFSGQERIAIIEEEVHRLGLIATVTTVTFDGLAVDAARRHGASVIVRGLRDGSDFDYETQMAGLNAAMAPDIETIFFLAAPGTRHLASTFIRQVAAMGGDVSRFVSASAAIRLTQKFKT